MQSRNHCANTLDFHAAIQESRTSRFNVQVSHPSKWNLLLDQFLASPMRLHRYRSLTTRMLENSIDKIDCGPSE